MIARPIDFVFGVGKHPRLAVNVAPELAVESLILADNLVRAGNGQQLQRHSVQHRKKSGVHPDSQRDRQNRHRRKPRILRQRPRSVPQIAPSAFQRDKTPRFPARFLDARDVAEVPSRRVPRLLSLHPPLAVLLFAHRQMKRKLVLQVAVELLGLEQRLHSHPVAHGMLLIHGPHSLAPHAICITLAIARVIRRQYSISSASFLRPAAVTEQYLARLLFADVPQSASSLPFASSRSTAGSSPSSS